MEAELTRSCYQIGISGFVTPKPSHQAAGLGMTSVLVVLGAMREIIGNGTLFDGADLLLGDWASALRIEIFQFDNSFLLALLPPGAFIGVGFLIALKNIIDNQAKSRQPKQEKPVIERARVTNA